MNLLTVNSIIIKLLLCCYLLSSCTSEHAKRKSEISSQIIDDITPNYIFNIGEVWANNAINTTIYRHHGIITIGKYQYTATFIDSNYIRIIRRDVTSDSLVPDVFNIHGSYDVSDTHNTISIGIDHLGYIHLSYGQHASKLRYRRSKMPWDISKWTDEISMTGLNEKHLTYPTFIIPRADNSSLNSKDLLFIYREGHSANGNVCIKKFIPISMTWKDIEPCTLVGRNQVPWTSNAYLNHPAIDSIGNIHLSYVWRTHFLGQKKILNNIGIDYAVSKDWGNSWSTSLGREYRLPITQTNSETIYAVSPENNLMNQTSSAIDTNDNPHIVYYANDYQGIPQYQHVWFNGEKWNHSFLSKRSKPFLLHGGGSLDIPISRPEILIDDINNVYLIYRADTTKQKMSITRFSPPNYDLKSSSTKILWNKDIGYAEPVIDRLRWEKDRILSMFIMKNGRASNRDITQVNKEPAYIVDWDIISSWE